MSTLAQCENGSGAPATEQHYQAPDVNIVQTRDGYLLEADLPGVNKSGLKLTVADGELTITGQRSVEVPSGTVLHRGTRTADFRRSFKLDPQIDVEKISAKLDQGVLTLTLPKGEKAKPRAITVA